jgi:CheY-like chemotaxis protein
MPNPRVLVVDDHPDTLRLFETYLSLSGFEVTSATSATEALRLAANGVDEMTGPRSQATCSACRERP